MFRVIRPVAKRLTLMFRNRFTSLDKNQNKGRSECDIRSVPRLVTGPVSHCWGSVPPPMVGSLKYSEEKQLLERNVFGPRRKKTRAEPQRSSHGAGKWCLQQSVLSGRTALGPGSGGERWVEVFDSDNSTRSTDNSDKPAGVLKCVVPV